MYNEQSQKALNVSLSQARFDASELITQRELVSRQVSEDLTERASTFGLILDDVSLVWSRWKIMQHCSILSLGCAFNCSNLLYCALSDTLDLWQGIHRGCWDETGGPARGRESPFRCRKGILTLHVIPVLWAHSKTVHTALSFSFYHFRQSNRSRQPSFQPREILRLLYSLPTLWWRLVMVW